MLVEPPRILVQPLRVLVEQNALSKNHRSEEEESSHSEHEMREGHIFLLKTDLFTIESSDERRSLSHDRVLPFDARGR